MTCERRSVSPAATAGHTHPVGFARNFSAFSSPPCSYPFRGSSAPANAISPTTPGVIASSASTVPFVARRMYVRP